MEGCRPRHPLCHSKGAEGDAPPFHISSVEPRSLRPAFLRADLGAGRFPWRTGMIFHKPYATSGHPSAAAERLSIRFGPLKSARKLESGETRSVFLYIAPGSDGHVAEF